MEDDVARMVGLTVLRAIQCLIHANIITKKQGTVYV